MKEYTQTELEPGNCWQTAIACVLEIEPERLPTQRLYDWYVGDDGKHKSGPSYQSALGVYLRKHHNLAYVEIGEAVWPIVTLREPGWHFMSGKTIRSATNGGKRHIVVARHGAVAWDPHPSRDGLLDDIRYYSLAPFPESWNDTWNRFGDACGCPACTEAPIVVPDGAAWVR